MMAPSPSSSILHTSLLLLLHLCISSQQQPPPSLDPADKDALLDIRSHLRDLPGSTFFASWDFNSSSDPCATFAGVVCSPADDPAGPPSLRVTALTLGTGLADSPGLTGDLPPSVAALTALTDLVVQPGRIVGVIPPDIGDKLRRLRLLSVSGNLVSGAVPESLAGLPDLHTLDLSSNRLRGAIPAALPSSPSLRVLLLAGNGGISGELPRAVGAGSRLLHLDLRGNSLSGSLPPLPATLRYLSVAANSMSGPLDAAFAGQLPDLAYLDLSMNAFAGRIPPAIFALPRLSSVLLQRNNFSGTVVVPPSAPPPWEVVDLSHNALSGTVPAALAAAGSLFMNSNRLTGAVPPEVAERVYSGQLTTFYAQHNFLTGFPTPAAAPLPDAVTLCLAYNCMALPPQGSAGCPASDSTLQSRPASQCSLVAAAGG